MTIQKVGLDFFPLSVNTNQDDKIALLTAKHGIVGWASVIQMFSKIYADKGYYYEWNEETQLLFSSRIGVECYKVVEIFNDAMKWKLFSEDKYKKYGILTSERIQKNYLDITTRRLKIEMIREYLVNGINVNIINKNAYIINLNVDILNDSADQSKGSKVKEVDNIALTSNKKSELQQKIKFNFHNNTWENITDKHKELWLKAYPACILDTELARMAAWILEAGAKGKKTNWGGFITRWLAKSQDKGGTIKTNKTSLFNGREQEEDIYETI